MAVIGGPFVGGEGDDFLIGDANELSVGIDNYGNSSGFALRGNGGNDIMVGDIYDPLGPDSEGDELFGGDGNDRMYGDAAPDLSAFGVTTSFDGDPAWESFGSSDEMYGEGGNDIMFGQGGFDTMSGGDGNDKVYGQADADYLYGDAGKDKIWGGDGGDQVYGGAGIDVIYGEDGNDGLYGEAFGTSKGDGGDLIRGGDGDDDIRGGAGADSLYGDKGDDSIEGGGLSSDSASDLGDSLFGGTGDDVISGHYGADVIEGGTGADELYGGDGGDLFVYRTAADSKRAGADQIFDFAIDNDVINLSLIDAIPGGADDAFAFRGAKRFSGDGQVRVYNDGIYTYVDVNIDGTSSPELRMVIRNGALLDQNDLLL